MKDLTDDQLREIIKEMDAADARYRRTQEVLDLEMMTLDELFGIERKIKEHIDGES